MCYKNVKMSKVSRNGDTEIKLFQYADDTMCQNKKRLVGSGKWIRSLGMVDYHLTDRRKILGDLENSGQININILNTKKTIFQSELDGKAPALHQVKPNVKQSFLHDEYKFTINANEYLFG